MCGIAGMLRPARAGSDLRAVDVVRRMTGVLRHRGPDGVGVLPCAGHAPTDRAEVAFGHTRLAIIDLSDRAAQPMANANGTIAITFNGEIYNYRELREALGRERHVFRTASDTEVILCGYEAWGETVFDRLEGMFALAIWDGRRQSLLLARDRLGIKPLYVHAGSSVLFASEIRALLASGLVDRSVDPAALEQYLAYQTVPSPRTMIRGVRFIDPGAVITIDSDGRESARTYWDLLDAAARSTGPAQPVDRRATCDQVHTHLDRAVRSHMVSDVPVGVFLSGGIDSSAIVSLLCSAGYRPRTFTVAFPGHGVDEAPFARAVAAAFGTEHQEIFLDERRVVDELRTAVSQSDHPSGDGINTYIVSKAVRQAGVKVALSGLGGDEFFGGYPSFRRFQTFGPYARAWQYSPRIVRRAVSTAVRSLSGGTVTSEKAAALIDSDGSVPEAFTIMRQLFTAGQRATLLSPALRAAASSADVYVSRLQAAAAVRPPMTLMASVSYAEARTYMHDVLLRDTDQMSMRHGLEVRVPLLDHRLVEHLISLPDAVKEPGGVPKRLLRESLGRPLPPVCTDRPKRGFVLPFDTWMKTALRPFCDHHLGTSGLAGRAGFAPAAVSRLWDGFLADDGRTNWARPWALVALNAWLEHNEVGL